LHPNFQANIEDWWQDLGVVSGTRMYMFQKQLKILKHRLKLWNKEVFENIFQGKKYLEKQMESIHQQIITGGHSLELKFQEE